MSCFTRLAIATAVGLVMSANAVAGSYASAAVNNLSFTLIDLNANDGIASSYTLLTGSGLGNTTALSVTANDASFGDSETISQTKSQAFAERSLTSKQDNASAHSEVSATGVLVSGSAGGLQTNFSASVSTGSGTSYYYYGNLSGIELAPHSVLIVSADASAFAWAGNSTCNSYYYYCNGDSSNASASMSLSYNYSSGSSSATYSFTDQVSASATAYGSQYQYQYNPLTGYYDYVLLPAKDTAVSNGRTLSAVFTNSSDFVQRASFTLSASVSGLGTSAVPEPGTLSLQLLGLSAMGVALRRLRKQG